MSTSPQTGDADIPKGLIDAVASLVATGPVPLGGRVHTGGDRRRQRGCAVPRADAGARAGCRGSALVGGAQPHYPTAGSDEVQVRGDLGIALAFQHRSRTVLDARVTGTEPDHPWRFVLMPQPEDVTLEILIDALGIHFYSLRRRHEALDRLWERLPSGDRGPDDADADAVLAASPKSALISVSHWDDAGDRETTDVVLAQDGSRCHVFVRDAEDPARLVAQHMDDDEWRHLLIGLATPR